MSHERHGPPPIEEGAPKGPNIELLSGYHTTNTDVHQDSRSARQRCLGTAAQIGERARRTTTTQRHRRHQRARIEHVLAGCEWCCGMADGRGILADAGLDELRDLWQRLEDEHARQHIAELARRKSES